MINRILPIHRTGWFYLILLFWGAIYYTVSAGGLNQVNQVNISLLEKVAPEKILSNKIRFLAETDVLTVYSSFEEDDVLDISALLSFQPNSQIVLLGNQSKTFIKKFKRYLSKKPRNNKIVIDSNNLLSATPLKLKSSMMFSSGLNWFRFTDNKKYSAIDSPYFIFTPLLLNERQSFPLVWQQQDKTYLTLPGEVLKQLSLHNELILNQHWQLSLSNTQRTLGPEKFSLGFLGDVFTTGNAYNLVQYNFNDNTLYRYNVGNNDNGRKRLTSVNQFINQQYSNTATSSPKPQYKVIIITDKIFHRDELVKPLLINLTKNNYLSQSFLTLLLCWVLGAIGFASLWFIQYFSFKQQFTSIVTYVFILFVLQFFMFNQQQWLEILPVLLTITGTWCLLLGYHKEVNLVSTAVNHQAGKSKRPSFLPPAVVVKKKSIVKSKQVYKSPQNFSPAATATLEKASSVPPLVTKPKKTSMPVEDLEQTLVIVDTQKPSQAQIKHHLSAENFGRYQVEGILGKGAMGIVYQGVDPKINRHVAIKTLQLSDDIDSPEFGEAKERFFREAQTAGGLSHSNIVTIYDVGEENNLGYIAMDLLTGAPLSLFTQIGHTLPPPLIYQLLIQITDALDYAHKQNVVHRDIKPGNIIYDDDLLKVTVTDFGIAYVSDHSKTRTGVIMGSPYYMSPEQILGLKVDGRSDIFSLGVTFYQLLTGNLPFEGESIATVAYQITKAKPIAVNQHNSKLPASALRITNKAMHKDIDKRYQSMAEFKLALVNALKRDFKITAS